MTVTNFNATYTSNINLTIPAAAFNISLVVAGGRGGDGGGDSGGNGGSGGNGRYGSFVLPNYVARTLSLRPGGQGQNGPGCFGRGTGRSSGDISGGGGGSASGCSGSGGGGGGASGVYDSVANNWIIVAGGGGGGGGGSWNRGGGNGGSSGGWGGIGGVSGGGNGNGATCGDGAGGGGGGGGTSGGGGGGGGCDFQKGGDGGGAGGSGYNSSFATITGDSSNSGGGYIRVIYTSVVPEILSFSASPNPQTSGSSGIPSNSVTLSWQTSDANSVQILSGSTVIFNNLSANGSTTVNTGLQSTAGSNSPATINYTLRACFNSVCVTNGPIQVSVYNDNTPNNFSIANQSNLEASSMTTIYVGQITGIDMITSVIGGPSVQVSNNNSTWSSSTTISNNGNLWVRAVSPSFNTDPSGLTNSSQFYVDVGTVRRFFTLTTRAPDVNETFNISNYDDNVPYPDIDTIANTPSQYITTAPLTVDDVEIDIELKTDNSNAQVRIKQAGSTTFGSWQNVRSI